MQSLRQHRRHRVHTDCLLRASSDDRLIADEVVDGSWSGLRVRSLGPARLGEPVRISIRVPGSRLWLEADGVVARVCPGRRADDGGETLGVAVRRMDGMHRLLLATAFRRHPEVPTSRGGRRDYARAVARIADDTGG